MITRFLTGVLIFALLFVIVTHSYACTGYPTAIINDQDPKWVSRYELLEFKGTDSHDNDPVEGGYCIVDYDWKWPDEAYWTWESLDGGTQAQARFSPPGEYTVELEVTDDETWKSDPNATCTVRVVEVSLTTDSEYVAVNDDDNNDNGTPDKNETGTVSNEDDLVAIHLSVAPTNLPGVVRLEVVGDAQSHIKIWKYSNKGQLEIPDGSTYWKEYPPDQLPATLHVEGITSTSTGETVLLSLKYKAPEWGEVYQSYNYLLEFVVVKVDVAFSGLYEAGELDPGKYINVNWDDDDEDGWQPDDTPPNGDYTGDKDDPNVYDPQKAPNGDDDFRSFTVSISPQEQIVQDFPNSKVSITFPSNVNVWQTSTKKTVLGESSELTSGHQFKVENLPKQLYLEGVSGSSTFKDVELKATWLPCSFDDFVNVSVFEVDLTGLFGFDDQQDDNEKRLHDFVPGSSDKTMSHP